MLSVIGVCLFSLLLHPVVKANRMTSSELQGRERDSTSWWKKWQGRIAETERRQYLESVVQIINHKIYRVKAPREGWVWRTIKSLI